MSTVVALGETHELEGFALAGVKVIATTTEADVASAWHRLGNDVGLVILSATAARVLQPLLDDRPDILTAVMT